MEFLLPPSQTPLLLYPLGHSGYPWLFPLYHQDPPILHFFQRNPQGLTSEAASSRFPLVPDREETGNQASVSCLGLSPSSVMSQLSLASLSFPTSYNQSAYTQQSFQGPGMLTIRDPITHHQNTKMFHSMPTTNKNLVWLYEDWIASPVNPKLHFREFKHWLTSILYSLFPHFGINQLFFSYSKYNWRPLKACLSWVLSTLKVFFAFCPVVSFPPFLLLFADNSRWSFQSL